MKIVYNSCIICGSDKLSHRLFARDHTVSNEDFEILECDNCSLRLTQNVEDASGIGKYYQSINYISHSDTREGLVNALYHKIRRRTLQNKKKLVQKITLKSTGNILDIGAGTGAFLDVMKKNNWNVTGLEPDEVARGNAFKSYGLHLQKNDELFHLPAESFDAICMWHVLEHVHLLNQYLHEFKKLLKPNGRIFIAVPNYTSYDAYAYQEMWAAYDVPRHLYHFSPKSMNQLLSKHGLRLKKILPMWYDSFYVSMLSEKNRTGKNNYIKAFCIGLISNLKALFDKEKTSSIIYIISKS